MKHRYSAPYNKLRRILKARRLELGLDQQQLCRRLKRHLKFVSQVETGIILLDVIEFREYAKALGLRPGRVLDQLD